ncbi:hypothetical protein [Actinomadura terrae]|uniref:hypothetical protein n=1 Tax=Actinomadura terrae TaxID=604353 RepID=UPI001FA72FD0|nr:hypothetical protein [Actinomadura terrae]
MTPVLAAPAQPPLRLPANVNPWYGHATGHWFAMLPWPSATYGFRLVEADTEGALTVAVWRLLTEIG